MTGHLVAALSAEWVKVRRSKLPAATFAAFTAAALIGALFMFVLADPDRATRVGLVGQKAQLSNLTADWHGLLSFLGQVVAVGGLMLYSFIASWVFGREHADDTLRYLLVLPVSRATIVAAKMIVTAAWCAAVTAWLLGLGMILGVLLRLPGWNAGVVAGELGHAALASLLMMAVIAPVPFIACIGRGYLPPLGAALAAIVVAQVAAALGAAGLVPWAIPALAVGLVPGTDLTAVSLIIAAGTAIAGVAGTLAWWQSGDAGL